MIVSPRSSSDYVKILSKRSRRIHSQLLTHPEAKKFYKKSYLISDTLRQKSARLLAGVGLAGAVILNPATPLASPSQNHELIASNPHNLSDVLKSSLQPIVPHYPTDLSPEQASKIEDTISTLLGIKVRVEMQGNKLNHQVGYIGYEQHLQRFPGDNLDNHDEDLSAGIAPGLGSWGYFATNRSNFTTSDYLREKYYSVAQTFLIPNWDTDFKRLREWYRFRKILIINPLNGHGVVTALADSGPATWTGKQFGASPEAMRVLGLHSGPRKGLVVFLFVDDPDNLVPLGPVEPIYK